MSSYGKVKPFNPKVDDWEVYEEKLRFYLAANDITDGAKKRSILLTVCGDSTFRLLRSLVPEGKLDVVSGTQTLGKNRKEGLGDRLGWKCTMRNVNDYVSDVISSITMLSKMYEHTKQ